MPDKKPDARVEMRDFPGLITNVDPTDLPPGAARDQVNVMSARTAVLEVRPGYRKVTFEDSQ